MCEFTRENRITIVSFNCNRKKEKEMNSDVHVCYKNKIKRKWSEPTGQSRTNIEALQTMKQKKNNVSLLIIYLFLVLILFVILAMKIFCCNFERFATKFSYVHVLLQLYLICFWTFELLLNRKQFSGKKFLIYFKCQTRIAPFNNNIQYSLHFKWFF